MIDKKRLSRAAEAAARSLVLAFFLLWIFAQMAKEYAPFAWPWWTPIAAGISMIAVVMAATAVIYRRQGRDR